MNELVAVSRKFYTRKEFEEELVRMAIESPTAVWISFVNMMKEGDIFYEFVWKIKTQKHYPEPVEDCAFHVSQTEETIPRTVLNKILRRKYF